MGKLLYLIIALFMVACGSKQQRENESIDKADSLLVAEFYAPYIQSEYGNDTVAIQDFIRQEAESLDSCYLIHYKSLIDGYDIRMTMESKWQPRDNRYSGGLGKLMLSNDDKIMVVSPFAICFPDNNFCNLSHHAINELDYNSIVMRLDESNRMCLDQYNKSPFFFFDVDFDGEKELIMSIRSVCQRGRNGYFPISLISNDTCCYIRNDILENDDFALNDTYYLFDDGTVFDYKNKMFICELSNGWRANEWHYYKMENGKHKLVKKIVEYNRNEPKVMRITYHNNDSTITNIPVDKDYSYTID